MIKYGANCVGSGAQIYEPVTIGFPSRENMRLSGFAGTVIGKYSIIRSGTIIYCDVNIGDFFQTGHNVVIRENTLIGNKVSIGTATIIDGCSVIGDNVNIQTGVYISPYSEIGDHVFIGPNVTFTNDKYPPDPHSKLSGPNIMDSAIIGAGATLLPGIRIGKGSFVAAGAVVTRDVPAGKMAIGSPAKVKEMPKEMVRD